MLQDTKYHGFPTAFAPLPNFDVSSYIDDRAFDVQPYATDSWTMPTLDFKYSGTGWSVVWANSYFYRHTQDVEDSSYGTRQVLTNSPCPPNFYCVSGLPAQPYLWVGDRFHDQTSSEARLSFDPIHNISGTFGLYYSNTHTRFTIPDTNATGLGTAHLRSGRAARGEPVHAGLPARADLDADQPRYRGGQVDLRRALLQVPGQMDAHPRRTAVLAQPDHRLHRGRPAELRRHAERPAVQQPVGLQSEGRAAAAGDRGDHGVRLGVEGLPRGWRAGQLPRLLVRHPGRGCHAHQVGHALDLRARQQDADPARAHLDGRLRYRMEQPAAAGGAALRLLPAGERREGAHLRRRDRGERPCHHRAAVPSRPRLRAFATSPIRATSRWWRSAVRGCSRDRG